MFIFVILVYVYLVINSEFVLGKYSLVNFVVFFVCYYLVVCMLKKEWWKKVILFGGIILYVVVFLVIFNVIYMKLFIYVVCIVIVYFILFVLYGLMIYDVIGRVKNVREWCVEYVVVWELWLNVGRICFILSFLCVVLFFLFEKSLFYLLCILGVGYFFIYFVVKNVKYDERNVSKVSVVM